MVNPIKPQSFKVFTISYKSKKCDKIPPGSDFARGLAPGLAVRGDRETSRTTTMCKAKLPIMGILFPRPSTFNWEDETPMLGLGFALGPRSGDGPRWGASRERFPAKLGSLRISSHMQRQVVFFAQNCGQWDKHVITNSRNCA